MSDSLGIPVCIDWKLEIKFGPSGLLIIYSIFCLCDVVIARDLGSGLRGN